jgi:hypothetical protein
VATARYIPAQNGWGVKLTGNL